MPTVGFSPIDSAVSILGLQLAQQCWDLLFHQTKIGYVLFVCGGLVVVIKSSQSARYGNFLQYVSIVILASVLLNYSIPAHELKSFQEIKNVAQGLSTESLQVIAEPGNIPLFLAYIDSFFNNFSFAMIEKLDHQVDAPIRFIKGPFKLQQLALESKQRLSIGLDDYPLDQQLKSFIFDHFLPLRNFIDHALTADNEKVEAQYSFQGQEQWEEIKGRIIHFLENDKKWLEIINLLKSFNASPEPSYLLQIQHSLIVHAVSPLNFLMTERFSKYLYGVYPYMFGVINAAVLAFFVPVLIVSILIRRGSLLLAWLRGYVWTKSLWVWAFFAYVSSLMMFRLQTLQDGSSLCCWEKPNFAVVGVMALIAGPLISAFLIWRVKL